MQKGEIAFITGASTGIGAEMARQLAARGLKLGLVARRGDLLAKVADEARAAGSPQVEVAVCDVADRDRLAAALGGFLERFGACDYLIANAGIGYPVPASRFDAAKAERIYAVNLFGTINAIAPVLPAMLARGRGHIVGLSSLAAYRAYPESHAYCASKSAVSAQLEGLRAELRPHGIYVTTICPGFVKTDMTAGNTFPMPFQMECATAARRMIGAIERRVRVYNFPRRLYWIVRATRLVPEALFAKLAKPPGGKSYKEPARG